MGSFSYVLHSFTMVFYLILQMKYVCASLKRKVLTVLSSIGKVHITKTLTIFVFKGSRLCEGPFR